MDLISSFLDEIQKRETRRAYRADLQRFFQDAVTDKSQVREIQAGGIQSYVRSLREAGEALSTQRRRLAALRRFYDWLIQEGIVSRNPVRHPRVKPLRPESVSSSTVILSPAEVEELVATAGESSRTGIRDQALILTIVYGALRRGEVAALTVDDVRPLGRYSILDLDDATGSDYVRIPETVVEAIERMKEAYGITKGPLWRSLSNQNRGAPMSPDAIYKVVRRVSKTAGLDPVSIDDLRRTGLQLALKGGASLPQVQAHGRFSDSGSAARLHDPDERTGALDDSAVAYIGLDVAEFISREDQ